MRDRELFSLPTLTVYVYVFHLSNTPREEMTVSFTMFRVRNLFTSSFSDDGKILNCKLRDFVKLCD